MEIRVVRLGSFAKCISEPLGVVIRTSAEQIVKNSHRLRFRISLPEGYEFMSTQWKRSYDRPHNGHRPCEPKGIAGESRTHSCHPHARRALQPRQGCGNSRRALLTSPKMTSEV